jgi:hypothetical protein
MSSRSQSEAPAIATHGIACLLIACLALSSGCRSGESKGRAKQLGNYPETGFEENHPVQSIWSCGRGGRGERDGVSRAPSHRRIVARSGATATPAKASG